eukprot:TRINITY_DN3719_c0_g1_i2.p1 TRINITY_DN3719_c0_g1~~TRINITY_DN3719_c0_g1_i2.p1  ORF type:complete len:203 (-),score=25.91 TRINITY_DN3719_c0_g1_i2:44-622(-)
MSEDHKLNDKIILNVGGKIYKTSRSTLLKYPHTLLGVMFAERNTTLSKEENGEHFIDRDGEIFRVILNFYRTGNITVPPNLSREEVITELNYFQIPHELTSTKQKILQVLFLYFQPQFEGNFIFQELIQYINGEERGIKRVLGIHKDMNTQKLMAKVFSEHINTLSQDGWGVKAITSKRGITPDYAVLQRFV